MNLICEDLCNYLNEQKKIVSYNELIKVEEDIENIIKSKIVYKTIINGLQKTKYDIYAPFYNKNKDKFRDNNPNTTISIVKENNDHNLYAEKDYPYYKNFLYSDYPNESFLNNKLLEIKEGSYPVIDLYLNRKNYQILPYEEFLCFNQVIKSLLNLYSRKISRNEAKRLTLEQTYIYKKDVNLCNNFFKSINSKGTKIKLYKESSLDYFLLESSNETGKLYKKMYEKYAIIQNNLLNDIIKKIKDNKRNNFECPIINIQEAKREDLLIIDFENKSEFTKILLSNTYRDFYNSGSKIFYNNYNKFIIDFDKIENILEENLIKNACILNTDNIIEMEYNGEDFINDGLMEFNNFISIENLNEKDKKVFIAFYQENLKTNLDSCLNLNDVLKKIIKYINKNLKNDKNCPIRAVYNIVDEGNFPYKNDIDNNFIAFLKDNKNISVNKLSNLIIYLEQLYFELAMKERKEYKEPLDKEKKEKIEEYYNTGKGTLLTKNNLSINIIRFLLSVEMKKRNDKTDLIKNTDNLFDYISNQFLWEKKIKDDNRFTLEIDDYKNLNINVDNAYDFYNIISEDTKNRFESEKNEILNKLKYEKQEELKEIKKINDKKIIEKILNEGDTGNDIDDITIEENDEFGDGDF